MNTLARLYFVFVGLLLLGCVGLLVVSMNRGGSAQLITSDGKAYYAWARSVLLDHDIDFSNDYAIAYPPDPLPPEATQVTPKGKVVNKYPIGLAILETPGLLFGHLVALSRPSIQANGVSAPYQLAVSVWLLLIALAGLCLLFRTMVALGSSPFEAFVFSTAIVVCTNLIHYMAKEPAMAHAAGMAVICLAAHDMARFKKGPEGVSIRRSMYWGALLGLLLLIRNSNVFVLPFFAGLLLHRQLCDTRRVAAMGASLLVVALLQPVATFALWGEFRLSTYAGEGLAFNPHGMAATLASQRHGLFIYHPWYAVLLVTTAWGLAKPGLRLLSASALASFLVLAAINGSWPCWWFGDSFGNRAFIEVLPPLSIVAALVCAQAASTFRRRLALASVAAIACVLNIYIWTGYLLRKYPHDGNHSASSVYAWPASRER